MLSPFSPLLAFFVLLGLQLGGVIDWSYLWITAPIWIAASAVVGIALVALLIVVIFLGLIAVFYK